MKGEDIVAQVKELSEPILTQKGMELVDVEYKMEQGSWVLRLYIDKPGGVTVDDCSDVSTELGMLLDVKDIITHAYNLEVSSPGLDRPLTKEKDFLKYTGKKVRIKTKQPISGRRNFSAILDGFSEGKIFLFDSEGKKWEIPFDSVEKARLEYEL
ncbi:MAG: ribosome maturation factor RimP [Deltaproteobacteria bacterium GWC2_42_51]|nr:MAG: ribosome maturation factor RimP [Deltaproteobacteria bacterium GWA2_42_85]OGP28561.1 MAG: ribosome maturation factor RimP [Deltaproteobacteria bacterium GWB2_42_7]OGP32872.1 MAG: ribosome maturation factor RimP [Deltaproteobacteria bacterium GWC2_42_51]OGP40720.1 MAG: ribosome maturation factor RimP [Deltaproteobacteria bacterium GWD2_42_10]OGP47266.1 MAG: ribosome maturation factor RimP [Deltaproteobacteria bacterium GWF2_42_12]OGQ25170.1 MAG: ribosome maturation factor RimP [Deltapro